MHEKVGSDEGGDTDGQKQHHGKCSCWISPIQAGGGGGGGGGVGGESARANFNFRELPRYLSNTNQIW